MEYIKMSGGMSAFPGSGHPNIASGEFQTSADNPFATFFGANSSVKVEDQDRYPHETFNLPKAYEGKCEYLERQIWWLLNRAEFFVERLCPWQQTENLHVKFDIWKFNHTLADLEPEQGVPRFVTQERESRSDSLVRRGLAFMIEHGFYKTAEGQEHYLMNLRQIADAVLTTVYYGVLQALLAGKDHYKSASLKKGYSHTQMEDVLRDSRDRWGIAQKTERGMYVLDARLKDAMSREQIVPNTWVFPPRMAIYLTMVPSSEVVYSEKGPGAADNLEKGKQNMLTFRGSQVHEASPIDVDFAGEPRDLLTRDRMIGSYFTMYDHIPKDDEDITYKSDYRSTYIYDMNADRFKKITLNNALNNCDFDQWVMWCAEGKALGRFPSLKELDGYADKSGDDFFARSGIDPTFYKAWFLKITATDNESVKGLSSDFDSSAKSTEVAALKTAEGRLKKAEVDINLKQAALSEELNKLSKVRSSKQVRLTQDGKVKKAREDLDTAKVEFEVARKDVASKNEALANAGMIASYKKSDANLDEKILFCKKTMLAFVAADIRIPVAFLLTRPFQRYEASSAILAKGGKDLGITYHGHHDFQLTDDVVHKTHLGHYTFYSKTVIRNPNCYAIAEDVFVTGYRGGEGCEFFSEKFSKTTKAQGRHTVQSAVEEGDAKSKSIFCMVIAGNKVDINNRDLVCNPLSITGRHVKEDVMHESLTGRETHPSAEFYHQFYDMGYWDLGSEDHERFEQEYEKINRTCFQGRQQIYNWNKKDFSNEVQETGHWGSQGTYEGCRAARTGRDVFLKRPVRDPAFL